MLIEIFRRWWRERRYSVALRVLGDVGCERILDLGTGTGEFLARAPSNYSVAIDLHPTTLSSSSPHFFVIADIHHLPLRDACFDVIACLEVIEHLSNPKKVIDEIYRVLRDGGVLLISTPETSLPWKIIWYLWTRTIANEWWNAHQHEFRLPTLLNILHGRFVTDKVERANFFILTLRSRAVKYKSAAPSAPMPTR